MCAGCCTPLMYLPVMLYIIQCQSSLDTSGASMTRSMVGLLAAVSVAMPALAPYSHGVLSVLAIVDGAAGAAIVAYLAAAPGEKRPEIIKKISRPISGDT